MMRSILSTATLLLAAGLTLAGEYHFPKGVPADAVKVTWYYPTEHYQHNGTVHDRRYNISARKSEPFGNANFELPWKTGGLDDSTNAATYKFYQLPGTITYWREPGRSQRAAGVGFQTEPHYSWQFPEGSVFGELIMTDQRSTEVRIMTKRNDQWDFRIYRPFGQRAEVRAFVTKETWRRSQLVNRHPVNVVNESALEHALEMTTAGVKEVLARDFKDVTNVVWETSTEGDKCYCPTTSEPGQIVPINYQGAFLHGNSCLKCHETTGKAASGFQPIRDWYGSVRGSDGVFSFSIFDNSCAARNGINRAVRLRNDIALQAR